MLVLVLAVVLGGETIYKLNPIIPLREILTLKPPSPILKAVPGNLQIAPREASRVCRVVLHTRFAK